MITFFLYDLQTGLNRNNVKGIVHSKSSFCPFSIYPDDDGGLGNIF